MKTMTNAEFREHIAVIVGAKPPGEKSARIMLQDDGEREYTCSPTNCGYDGKTYCQNCGGSTK